MPTFQQSTTMRAVFALTVNEKRTSARAFSIVPIMDSNHSSAVTKLPPLRLSSRSTSKPQPQPRRVHLSIIHTPSPLATIRKAQPKIVLFLAGLLDAVDDNFGDRFLRCLLRHLKTPHQTPRQRPNIIPIRNRKVLSMPVKLLRYITIDVEHID